MFNNIGKKIKTLAKVVCIIGIVLTGLFALGSIIMTIVYANYSGLDVTYVVVIVAVIIILAAMLCLLFWLSSFTTYGFGQLVDNSDALVELKKNDNCCCCNTENKE